jgi:hypothetical protein
LIQRNIEIGFCQPKCRNPKTSYVGSNDQSLARVPKADNVYVETGCQAMTGHDFLRDPLGQSVQDEARVSHYLFCPARARTRPENSDELRRRRLRLCVPLLLQAEQRKWQVSVAVRLASQWQFSGEAELTSSVLELRNAVVVLVSSVGEFTATHSCSMRHSLNAVMTLTFRTIHFVIMSDLTVTLACGLSNG